MPIKDKHEFFVWMLSDLHHGAERSNKVYQEIAEIAQDPDVKEALSARAFISEKIQKTLDECFRIIGQKPIDTRGRLHDVFAEDFRRELAEIESKEGRRLFALAKMNRLTHLRIAEYEVLIALADSTGHYAVGVLLESCLADKMVFVERTRELLRHRIEQRMAA